MKFVFLVSVLVSLALVSCKKEEELVLDTASTFEVVNSVGSYWVYETFTVDSNDVTVSTGIIDTVKITGDTIINGNAYSIYYGSFMGSTPDYSYKRDSSGYIVNEAGVIEYSYVNFDDVLSAGNDGVFDYSSKMVDGLYVNVPAGNFKVVNRQTYYSNEDGSPVNECGDYSYIMHNSYSSKVGLVFSTCPFYVEITACGDRLRKLINYHIE